jgi:hypothetical protein
MGGSTENRASGGLAGEQAFSGAFTWNRAESMLPYVRQIVADILGCEQRLARMYAEKESLDRKRRSLAWPERARRYQLQEEIESAEQDLRVALTELEALGVVLIESEFGQVGFPTLVDDQPAYFSWRPGEDGLLFWHYADSGTRQAVPPAWTRPPEPRRRGSRSGPRA